MDKENKQEKKHKVRHINEKSWVNSMFCLNNANSIMGKTFLSTTESTPPRLCLPERGQNTLEIIFLFFNLISPFFW